jgi:RNA polymerase sigma-B factor
MQTDITSLLQRYHRQGDQRARDEAIEASLPLVRSIARRFAGRGEPLEDLIQVGTIGLIKAVDRFDPSRGFAFTTYATPTVVGEIKRHFRDHGWDVRVPRALQELIVRIPKEKERLTRELGRPPTLAELAAGLGVVDELLLEAMQATTAYNADVVNRGTAADDEGSVELLDVLGRVDEGYDRCEERTLLREGMAALDERERRVLILRFTHDWTQSEIAQEIGHSQMHVSRIVRGAIEKMRAAIAVGDSSDALAA